ncbi:peptide ABC transporter substrate-binding protein [Pelagibius sp. CAU 1746]|uniref:peptide ABC transporter substrate-binding protein n=1 Tax=Pelagibius sp. CAU 1746 TaxID=3140370 RepID=UPI00325AED6B
MLLKNFRRAALGFGLAVALTGGAQAEKVLRVGNMGEPESLDPHFVQGVWENRIVGNMFLGLTTEDASATPIPGAAESWTISDDGKTYTFKLRDHSWSDGTPVTAGDFVYSLRRILLPETAAEYASLLFPIENAQQVNSGEVPADKLSVRAVDDKTLEVKLVGPTPFFLEQLTHYTAFPVPRHLIEKHGQAWTKPENIAVNGPYTLKNWVPNDQITLIRNDKFYDAANVKIDTVVYYPQEDRTAVQKRFRAGEIDWAADFASDQFEWLKSNLSDETRVAPYLGIYYYPMNLRKPPFDDKRVRQALSMAIDREIITDKVLKTGELPAYSFVPPGAGGYGNPSMVSWMDEPYSARLEKAKALLAEAGYGPGNPLKFTLSYNTSENHKRIAIAIASMWKQHLGVETELFNSEVKVHYRALNSADFSIARAGWIADYNDAQNFLYLLETRTGPNNYSGFSNSEFDKLMVEAGTTGDMDMRSSLMAKAEAIAMEEQPVIPIYYYVSKNLVSDRLTGWEPNAKDVHRVRYMDLK